MDSSAQAFVVVAADVVVVVVVVDQALSSSLSTCDFPDNSSVQMLGGRTT